MHRDNYIESAINVLTEYTWCSKYNQSKRASKQDQLHKKTFITKQEIRIMKNTTF